MERKDSVWKAQRMQTIIAAFQRAFDNSLFDGIALTLQASFLTATVALWVGGATRLLRRRDHPQSQDQAPWVAVWPPPDGDVAGQQSQRLNQVLFGLMILVLTQTFISELGLYTPIVGVVFLALLVIGLALAPIAFWRAWRRFPYGAPLVWTVARGMLVVAFLALGLIHAFIPSSMPRAI
jgi:hypothetical protein